MPMIVVTGGESFMPSGMNKNGTQKLTGSWTEITGWTADTDNYPGSTLSGNGLRAQGSKPNASVNATLAFSGASGTGPTQQARILVNGTVVATGQQLIGASGTLTASATVALNEGDVITVQAFGTAQLSGWESTISAAGSHVRIT
ncbi:hypothetical protein [Nocardia sp. CC201C]|uniref:hypothetical protein n=1 Tax=Nocardia sp. CC201C TaxID=3044575 RepID=UPI0024A93BEC|nr:hypothetical protein [Nocardia sp. CC201C]